MLLEYCRTRSEEALYRASLLSEQFIMNGIGPEEITAIHFEAFQTLVDREYVKAAERVRAVSDAHQFLLEVMINYGAKYKEYLDLRVAESVREAERRADTERERAEEAERIEQERSELLAAIAHELRTPITVAKGNVAIAARKVSEGVLMGVPPLLVDAEAALDRLSTLSADLVALSRGEIRDLELEPLHLDPIVERSVEWGQILSGEKGLSLNFRGPDNRLFVSGSPDALLTVFANLISNAIRYTPSGHVTVSARAEGQNAVVEVSDTGIGIPLEEIDKIFDKFYRGHEARRIAGGGTGLGLAIANQLVLAHGGRLDVCSDPGKGSTFRVSLPLLPEEDAGRAG